MPEQSSDDLDHTDELPVLLETVVLDDGVLPEPTTHAPDDTSEHTVLFAGTADPAESHAAEVRAETVAREAKILALEADIARLSSRWREIEGHLAEKDTLIADLNRTIATLRQSRQQDGVTERRHAEELAERDSRLRELATNHERRHREDDAELARLRADLATAREAAAALEAERAVTPPPLVDAAEIQALREHTAALEAYIDSRRAWWEDAKAAQATLAQRIAALEHELAVGTRKLAEATAFSARESQRAAALRAELVDYARRLEISERELRALRTDAAPTATGASTTGPALDVPHAVTVTAVESTPAPSPTPAPSASVDDTEPDAPDTAAQGIEAIAQLEAEVGYKRQQVAAQLIELRDREQRLSALTTELERVRHDLAAMQAEIQHNRSDVARLERAVIDKDRALQARDTRIATLQGELDQRLSALRKLSSTDLSHQGLHSRMAEQSRMVDPLAEGAHSPELICLTGDAPKRFALTKRTVTVGRSEQCDLQIMTHFVSREHARVSVIDNTAVIEDLGSRNGIFVNSVKVNRQKLQQGDLITIGETQFRFIESMAH